MNDICPRDSLLYVHAFRASSGLCEAVLRDARTRLSMHAPVHARAHNSYTHTLKPPHTHTHARLSIRLNNFMCIYVCYCFVFPLCACVLMCECVCVNVCVAVCVSDCQYRYVRALACPVSARVRIVVFVYCFTVYVTGTAIRRRCFETCCEMMPCSRSRHAFAPDFTWRVHVCVCACVHMESISMLMV
jgi:hypothetical protein